MLGRRILAVTPAPVAVIALLLPWYRSGTAVRSAFSLARALNGSGLIEARWAQIVLESCDAFPVVIAASIAAALLGSTRISAIFAVLVAGGTVLVSAAAIAEIHSGIGIGPWVGLVASPLAALTSILAAFRYNSNHD